MADFAFNVLTHSPERLNVISTKLGPDADTKYTDKDKKKAVKLGSAANHVFCAGGDEIEGFIDSIEVATEGGFSFGGVARGNRGFRVEAQIGVNQGATPAAVGDLVVADVQLARGTVGLPQVKTGTPARHLWRIMSVRGTGAAGTVVVLELL
ncbi:hypothetical protein D9M69_479090 [compost metagenome]